jgi:hypothetical protein
MEISYNLYYKFNEPRSGELPGSIVTVITSGKGNTTMTQERLPNSTSVLQTSAVSSDQPRSGRRAFGCQRRMSPYILARNIAESILTHRQLGQDRPISFYTESPHLQALVQARLEAIATTMP